MPRAFFKRSFGLPWCWPGVTSWANLSEVCQAAEEVAMATSTAPLPKRMRVKVAGRYWQLQFVNRLPKAWCVTDNPTRKNKGIRIRRSLKEADLLDTLIHELLHASQWSVGEDWNGARCGRYYLEARMAL